MTLTDKIAALPGYPTADDSLRHGYQWAANRRDHCLTSRLSLLLDTVRAYTEAVAWTANAPMASWADSVALRDATLADLRALQKHLESEK